MGSTTAAVHRRPGLRLSPAFVALALLFLRLAVVVVVGVPNGGGLGPCELAVVPLGYPCEDHEVTTVDGYILSLQRIPSGRASADADASSSSSRPGQPVLLQHGVLADGVSWLLSSPEESLPFILADRGFDVWIANNRGTHWSRHHVSLVASDPLYWDWSWDDLVINDLPAMVDFVRKKTGEKPHYIGHSMGTLVALAAFSEGLVVDDLKSAALLTPVAYLANMTTPICLLLAKAFVGEMLLDFGVGMFDPGAPPVTDLMRALCRLARLPGMNCYDLLGSITGSNYCLNGTAVDVFLDYEPQPTSTRTMVHFAQTVRDGVLNKYDYGPDLNIAKYGQPDPPVYQMSDIPASFPLFLSYGGRDMLADPYDVGLLLDDLRDHDRDKLTVHYLHRFAHLDFVIGVCAKDYVYKDMIAFFNRFN